MSGSSGLSGSTQCVCTPVRLKYFGCLCGAAVERLRRGIAPENCDAVETITPEYEPYPEPPVDTGNHV